MSRRVHSLKQILFYGFLIAYVLLLAKALLFKEISPFELFHVDRIISRSVQLIPFQTILAYTRFNIWIALMNVIGNIVLFIPLGIYLQIFKRNQKLLHSVALVCAVSLCVEVVQYGLGIGRADLDDVILNTFGGLLGVLIYRMLYLLLKDANKTKTAVTFLFCFVCVAFVVGYLVLVYVLGYQIKIF